MIHSITNRLAKEHSPYLRSAAHQPVQWYPWLPEAFQEAERLGRPILLDIGAAWCHWCHVIDRESYENEEISKFINENFIAIKVDRDERPDIDSRFQLAVGALTGQGGWPLTAFLTPQGEVFYGGTYFPPDDQYGQVGFKQLLKRIAELYQTRKNELFTDAKKISVLFEGTIHAPAAADALKPEAVEQCRYALKYHFDFAHGGFGNAPKFFHTSALDFALHQYCFRPEPWLRVVLEKTLEAMAKGGVFDQLGGGFHRYSIDERWIVPHFEKMSCDNAGLLSIYSKAYRILNQTLFREVAEGIVRWAREVMTDTQRGGFYASQDADVSSHDDGDFYTWTEREVKSLLTPEESRVLLPHFDIEAQGEMHHDPSRNVLFVAKEPEVLARELELKPQEVIQRIESAKLKLGEARRKRKRPFVDSTLYTNWNGMWIRAFLTASRFLNDTTLAEPALKTLQRFQSEGLHNGGAVVRFLSETQVPCEGLLEDHVELLAASIDAFEITADFEHLRFARRLARLLIDRFGAEDGGFYDIATAKQEGPLRYRERRIQDTPTSSANATAAFSLLRLFHLTSEEDFQEQAVSLLRFFYDEARALSHMASGYMSALNFHLKGATKVVLIGKREDLRFQALHGAVRSVFRPDLVYLPLTEPPDFLLDPSFCAMYEESIRSERPRVWICRKNACHQMADQPEALIRQLMENKDGH